MGNALKKAAALDLGIQWGFWTLAAAAKSEKFYDLVGSATFALLTLWSYKFNKVPTTRQKINSGLVLTWSARLGTFLFMRVLKDGHDKRFNHVRDNPSLFWIYWTIQGVWVFITLLPILMVNTKRQRKDRAQVNVENHTKKDYVGWIIWSLGFFLETVSDFQKFRFKSIPANQNNFISSGLWSISQHPNYLGEILMWSGLYISSSSALSGWEHVSVISPIFTFFLLTKVSGIPLLDIAANKRWGNNPAYINYVKNTAKLIPGIW